MNSSEMRIRRIEELLFVLLRVWKRQLRGISLSNVMAFTDSTLKGVCFRYPLRIPQARDSACAPVGTSRRTTPLANVYDLLFGVQEDGNGLPPANCTDSGLGIPGSALHLRKDEGSYWFSGKRISGNRMTVNVKISVTYAAGSASIHAPSSVLLNAVEL